MRTKMFFVTRIFALVALGGLTACTKDNPVAPVVETVMPTAPKEHGWQLVVQAENPYYNSFAVSAAKSDKFATVSLGSVDVVNRTVVYDLRGQNDTAWVGYGVVVTMFTQNFVASTVAWGLSGSIRGLDSTKAGIGNFVSMFEAMAFDFNGSPFGPPFQGSHIVTPGGDDWKVVEAMTTQGGVYAWRMATVVMRPLVCKTFSAQHITSDGISEVQADAFSRISGKYPLPAITVTCNPAAPALREEGEAPMKLVEYMKTIH
ncbi:MAG: hypothetical protein WC783_01145 [Candidatus Paceibacterota bacterium]|jgi:hypothetical protein